MLDTTFTAIESSVKYLLSNSNELSHFWVDAICIDQNNIPGRNLQVSRTKDIYEGANKVIFWLGSAASDSDIAMDMIEHLARVNRRTGMKTARTPVDSEVYGPAGWPFDDKPWAALGQPLHRQ
jgi:hypothetical protein